VTSHAFDRAAVEGLETGKVELLGALPYASNYTYLTKVTSDEELLAVYKPRRGERPLWDFPEGTLSRREVCAYLVSEAGGFDLVPPTVLREDGPLGDGSLQLFIHHDPERHYFALAAKFGVEEFAALAALDVVLNNADRKAGHVIEDVAGRVWALDHGVCFHPEDKLRTVIWELAEKPLSSETVAKLERLEAKLRGSLGEELSVLLSPEEARATRARLERLLAEKRYPAPRGHHPLPWPLV
jgi:uncharacterized repeat protein (TIGR03843 family)